MAFNINEIRARLTNEGARPNLFEVTITNPANNSADSDIPFLVRAASLPTFRKATIPIPYFGRIIKLAGDRTFDPWSVEIMNDENFKIRNALEEWSGGINKLQNNVRTLTNYKSQATVKQFGKNKEVLRVYEFHGVYPSEISGIPLDWSPSDAIETYRVTFEYDYFTVSGGTTGDAGGR